jgi:hypothetical protein
MKQITLKNIIVRITVISLICISGLNAYAASEASMLASSWPTEFEEIEASIVRLAEQYGNLAIENGAYLDPNIDNIRTLSINLFNETFSTLVKRLATKFEEFIEISQGNPDIVVNPYNFIILQEAFEKLNLLNQSFDDLLKDPSTTDNTIISFMNTEYLFNLGGFMGLFHSFNKIMKSLPETLELNSSAIID